ncbi:MAG: hypothetical protein KDN05_17210 [Verrucomicrobiae bacterium]|nr:hypothetical protein [Verrucomicrobiae bacterium]
MELTEFHQRPRLNFAWEFPGGFSMEYFGTFLTGEILNHSGETITQFGNDFKGENADRDAGCTAGGKRFAEEALRSLPTSKGWLL